ncbi:50S ribosome-binding protein YggL [Aeromonas hydrophila]|uniref:50S ribosome-binding protein YggL n=1 Tax=Aeromonas hydrophila TaxID=644 RepID=UPI000332B347|nr:50S ribosome-binding protein YggL [Aeromonas hydrophila]AGM42223.1 hypothetical protein AHML_02190 [Aeromonas hydrophila ML09-119]AHX30951.1 hypothetical protein V428_02330 [Aeromonas hydrophila subsp. hydrophila AL09-71]AHX67746.1 hypothetical protein V429_02330 [Aeromonas hydrophila pc104A]AJE38199.1 hypothetical protein V469_20990 [Aeromonas hydrophila J-1]AKJ36497.1 hypothetical protein U876_21645 [Aeromonas hydrophila NJ-35]
MTFQPSELGKKRSRRLRKKLHLDEFQELGLHLVFTIEPSEVDFEEVLDRWLEYIEPQGWIFGGGGSLSGHEISGYLCQSAKGSLTESDRKEVANWLTAQPWVIEHRLAPLSDAWYGSWEE